VKRGRCIQCGRRLGSKAEFLFNRPDGTRAFLCGRASCERLYNDAAPDPEGCSCGAHPKAAR
jgi:hypothetical protein